MTRVPRPPHIAPRGGLDASAGVRTLSLRTIVTDEHRELMSTYVPEPGTNSTSSVFVVTGATGAARPRTISAHDSWSADPVVVVQVEAAVAPEATDADPT